MRYSLDQIEAFVLTARLSSISKAARALGKAQSTISVAISNLEIDLGVELFDRSGKFLVLTDHGRSLLVEAESVLFHCGVFEERSLNLMREVEELVRICVDATIPPVLLGSALGHLVDEYPHVRIETVNPGSEGIVAMVQSDAADLGLTLVNYRYPKDIGFYRLGQVTLVNVVGRGHPLAEVGRVRFSHLNSVRQIEYAPNIGRVPTNQHLDSSETWAFTGYAEIVEMVLRGFGWAVLPEYLAAPYLQSGDLVRLTLEAYPRTPWQVNTDVIWSTRRKSGVVAWRLREIFAGRDEA